MTQLEITVATVCSIDCSPFCPQRAFRKVYYAMNGPHPPSLLSLSDFDHAISTVPADVVISFSGFADPGLNPESVAMMEHARAKGHPVHLYTTFIGFTPKDIERIRKVAPEVIVFHTPDDRGITHLPTDSPAYREVIMLALSTLDLKGFSRMGSTFVSNERAGNCENAPLRHVHGPFHCGKLNDPEFVMTPSGVCTVCCMDWRLEQVVGRLLPPDETTWDGIVNGDAYRRIVRASYGFGGAPLCRRCKWAEPVMSPRAVGRITLRNVNRLLASRST